MQEGRDLLHGEIVDVISIAHEELFERQAALFEVLLQGHRELDDVDGFELQVLHEPGVGTHAQGLIELPVGDHVVDDLDDALLDRISTGLRKRVFC